MKRALVIASLFVQVAAAAAWAGESLIGTWRLDRQEINGENANSEPLTLKVLPSGDKLSFAFSVPVNNVYFVSMTYVVKLDGSAAEVKNAQGEKIGTIQITSSGASQYKLTLKGPNRPNSSGLLTVSTDGKTLISEADTIRQGRPVRSKQTFSRY